MKKLLLLLIFCLSLSVNITQAQSSTNAVFSSLIQSYNNVLSGFPPILEGTNMVSSMIFQFSTSISNAPSTINSCTVRINNSNINPVSARVRINFYNETNVNGDTQYPVIASVLSNPSLFSVGTTLLSFSFSPITLIQKDKIIIGIGFDDNNGNTGITVDQMTNLGICIAGTPTVGTAIAQNFLILTPGVYTANNWMSLTHGTITYTFPNQIVSFCLELRKLECPVTSRLYVDANKPNGLDGSNWANAFKYLGDALRVANTCSNVQEIWVKQGTYYPIDGNISSRDSSFRITRNGIKLYGGFAGTETDLTQRPIGTKSTLSGDLNKDDVANFANNVDNSYHIMTMFSDNIQIDNTTIIDGFNFIGGNANSNSNFGLHPQNEGGALYIEATGAGNYCSPKLNNNSFSNNNAINQGGAVFIEAQFNATSNVNIANSIFQNNQSQYNGGAIFVASDNNGTISTNIINSIFSSNKAINDGGAILNNGLVTGKSSLTLINSTFTNNSVQNHGAAICNITNGLGAYTYISFRNSILYFNTSNGVAESYFDDSNIGTVATNISSSDIESFGPADIGNPLFISASDFHLQPSSPCINTGNNTTLPTGIATDITGVTNRILETTVDMGAYENRSCTANPILYVDAAATGTGDGSSWANALTNVSDALNLANYCSTVTNINVAQGTYYPSGTQSDANNTISFQIIRDGLTLQGGFPTGGAAIANPDLYPTILSGDIGNLGDNTDNSYHVMIIAGKPGANITSATTVSGFTFMGGNANFASTGLTNGQVINHAAGGGLYLCGAGAGNVCSPSISFCKFNNNNADYSSGGMLIDGSNGGVSSPTITSCSFDNNVSNAWGGAIGAFAYPGGGTINSNIIKCIFTNNKATNYGGGGIYGIGPNGGALSLNLYRNIFDNNTAYNGGAINFTGSGGSTNATVSNCAFSNNLATASGGAIYLYETGNVGTTIKGCTFYKNTAIVDAGGIYDFYSTTNLNHVVFYANTGTTNNDINVAGGSYAQDHNSFGTTDPIFFNTNNLIGADGKWASADDGLELSACSPAINAGIATNNGNPYDVTGAVRFYGGHLDLGAYEQHGEDNGGLAQSGENNMPSFAGPTPIEVMNAMGCRHICNITPVGAAMLQGMVNAMVTVDASVPSTSSGEKYVQRHFDIEPMMNAASATATIKLYFANEEFQAYNAAVGVGLQLPDANFSTTANTGNLHIIQYHGTSSTHLPGSYTGSAEDLVPTSVTWNALQNRWEVTISVTGFSGFFAKAGAGVLPLHLLSFTGTKQNNSNVLQWKTANELNIKGFELERSTDGNAFIKIASIAPGSNYNFTDNDITAANIYYYRLKIIDNDGKIIYSNIIKLGAAANLSAPTAFPNPTNGIFTLNVNDNNLIGTNVSFIDINGKQIKSVSITGNSMQVDISNLSGGMYLLKFVNGRMLKVIRN